MDHLLRKPEAGALCRAPVSTPFFGPWHFTFYTTFVSPSKYSSSFPQRVTVLIPNSEQPPTIQDSVVGGNVHTGTVVHNHYHQSPSPPQMAQQVVAPQPLILQTIAPQYIPIVTHKKIHTTDWIVFGVIALIMNVLTAGACLGFSTCVSLVGIVSLLPQLSLKDRQPHHPEAPKVGTAIVANILAFLVGFIVWLSWRAI